MGKRVLLIGLLFLLSASSALGDGCYIPERAVRKIPEIPAQRTIIAWKDGVETLIIASTLDSESQSLGWIIPVPAVPDTIEKETPGTLRTMNFCLQPKIIHDLHGQLIASIVFAIVGILLIGTFLFNKTNFPAVITVVIIAAILWSLMLPANISESAYASKAANVQVEKSVKVGSYDVRVLTAEKPGDLNAWLDESGFAALPEAADEIVVDYISNGWVFTAIKLSRAESGVNTPHPIRMSFASERAVYPLKLTSIAGGVTDFEIFVIGDETASSNRLVEEFCDRFENLSLKRESDDKEGNVLYRGDDTGCQIGHQSLCRLMWDGCVIAKYAGTVAAANMNEDIEFDWRPFSAFQEIYYTRQGAFNTFSARFIAVFGAWCMISMILFRHRVRKPGGTVWYFTRAWFPFLVLFALCGAVWYAAAPKLESTDMQLSWLSWDHQYRLCHAIDDMMEEYPVILKKTEMEIVEAVQKTAASRGLKNPAGGEIIYEDSPGNFTIEKLPDKVVFRVYDMAGGVMIAEYPLAEQKQDEMNGDVK